MTRFGHETVLLEEAVSGLNVHPDGIYVDCTLGGGGHSAKIASMLVNGKLYAFDQDQTAIDFNTGRFAEEIDHHKVVLIHANFRNIQAELAAYGVNSVNGILYDLGVSSPQFDDAERGFSYRHNAALDMRMDQNGLLTAQDVVNDWSYQDLVRIFYRYGEEKFAKSIARKIEQYRTSTRIVTTEQLVDIIKEGIPAAARRHGGHPAKKVFQALRITVNDELTALETSLEQAFKILSPGGRISVITFQSLEDRLVKTMFRERSQLPDLPAGLPVVPAELQPDFTLINRKPILPDKGEITENHRAHSAKLRVIEKNETIG